MATAVGTVALIDAESITRLMRSLDVSGNGGGPWLPVHCLADRDGEIVTRDNPFATGRSIKMSTSVFARTTNTIAYANGDIVTDTPAGTSFVGGVPSLQPARAGSGWKLLQLRLRKNSPGVTGAIFRVHLFKAAPTGLALDNSPFVASGNAAYLGFSGDGTMTGMGDGAMALFGGLSIGSFAHRFGPTEENIYWLLEARGAYTPVSAENFELEMTVEYD